MTNITWKKLSWAAGALGALAIAAACSSTTVTGEGGINCGTSSVECSGTCTVVARDSQNCGACGKACAATELCSAGTCVPASGGCTMGTTKCGTECVDTKSDGRNCGACGTKCGTNKVCSASACADDCAPSTTKCGQSCVNQQTDRTNCGGCGTTCKDGEICNAGKCAISCQQGLTKCTAQPLDGGVADAAADGGGPQITGDYCANLQTDNLNCGACGTACGAGGVVCQAGSCTSFPGSVLLSGAQGSQINSWIGFNKNWTLCYRRTTHGAGASTFHNLCNNKGPTVTVATLNTGVKIGGYAAVSWTSSGTYIGNSNGFLFSLTNNFKHTCGGAGGCNYYQYDGASYGPTFGGGHDWYNDTTSGYCNIGFSYACRVGTYGSAQCRNDFCGNNSNSWTITEMEVWY